MLNPDQFDPLQIGRYTVVRVRIYFSGDSDLKFFVVLNHVVRAKNSYCTCLKATSKTAFYEGSPEMLKGCVLYKAGAIDFFKKKTVIQIEKTHNIGYDHFERSAKDHEFKVEGKMPTDFHQKLVAAIKNSDVLSANEKTNLLKIIAEKPAEKATRS